MGQGSRRRGKAAIGKATIQVGNQTIKSGLVAGLRPGHDDRLRIRRPQQPPSLDPVDPHAVDVAEFGAFTLQQISHPSDKREFPCLAAFVFAVKSRRQRLYPFYEFSLAPRLALL